MKFTTQKITIVGGSGFVGTNLCRQLHLHGQNFEILDLKMSHSFPEKCKIADVRDINSLREGITGDIVVNLAAVHRDDVSDISDYRQTNVIGAENIAQICTLKDIKKIIFTSTVAVYGFIDTPADENHQIKPFNEYGRTKFEAEKKLRNWQNEDRENSLIIIRPTVIFGEGNRGNVFNLLNQIVSGRFIMIGAGRNKKSMAYVGNVAAFLQTCINTNLKSALFNYVDTPDLTMNELVSYARKRLLGKEGTGVKLPYFVGMFIGYFADMTSILIGRKLPISSIRVKKFTADTQFTSAKEQIDGFVSPFTLIEGIDRTLESEYLQPDPEREIFYTE